MEQFNYRVQFEPFTERHYIEKFHKEYKNKWLATERTIIAVCERIDNMLQYNRADLISTNGRYRLVKLDFAVEGTRMSPKASGNRCVLFVDEDTRAVKILLVYSKNEISSPNETQKWKRIIKDAYGAIARIFGLRLAGAVPTLPGDCTAFSPLTPLLIAPANHPPPPRKRQVFGMNGMIHSVDRRQLSPAYEYI
jgi:hypothetical protein